MHLIIEEAALGSDLIFFSHFTAIYRFHRFAMPHRRRGARCAGGGACQPNPAVGVVGTSDVTNAGADSPRILALLGMNDVGGHDDTGQQTSPTPSRGREKERERMGGEGESKRKAIVGTEGSVY